MSSVDYVWPVVGAGLLMYVCYFCGHWNCSSWWIVLLVLLHLLSSLFWKGRQKRVIALQQAALFEKETVLDQLRDLPAWVHFPDTERVEWINKVINQLWPYITEYARHFIKQIVEPQLVSHLPKPLKHFKFDEIDIGSIPLRVGGIKVYTDNVGRDRIVMDMDMSYAGDCNFGIRLGIFKGGLSQLQFKGKLRAILSPLLPQPPLVGGVCMFFLDEPHIDFDLTGLGEFVELPGLIGAVRNVVKMIVSSICVLPNEIVVPLVRDLDIVKLRFPEQDGVLIVRIIEARNLENRDCFLSGKSDPYAICTVGAQAFKTKTIDNSLNPVWNEPGFEAVIDQVSGQQVSVEVFDDDPGDNDEFIGRLVLETQDLARDQFRDQWYQLDGVKSGEIRLMTNFFGLTHKKDVLRDNFAAKFGQTQAVLSAYVDNISDLPTSKRDLEPSPYVQMSLGGKQVQKSIIRSKTCHPLYQQSFVFLVSNLEQQVLRIEAIDSQNKKLLGEMDFQLKKLIEESDLELIQQTMYLRLGPHSASIVLSLRLRILDYSNTKKNCIPKNQPSVDLPESSIAQFDVAGTTVNVERHNLKSMTSQKINTGLIQTRTTITPQYLLDTSGSSEPPPWLNVSFHEGAQTSSDKPRRLNLVQRIQNTPLLSFGKLNKRRSLSANFDGYIGRIHLSLEYTVPKSQLIVTVHSAEQLRALNFDSTADPYVKVKLIKKPLMVIGNSRSPICTSTLNPEFNFRNGFKINHIDFKKCTLLVEVKDSCNYGWFKRPPVMGQLQYQLSDFNIDQPVDSWFPLTPPTNGHSQPLIPMDPIVECVEN